jgi:hypothetical protein
MTHFLLLHGGQHGGWCWQRLQAELAARGFESTAPDLPMQDERAGAREWAAAAAGSLAADHTGADVVVVAHSLGGMALPLTAELLGARRQVYLAATVPQPGLRYADYLATEEGRDCVIMPITKAQPGEDTRGECTWPVARDHFYSDCAEPDARWAWEQLRPRATTVFTEPATLEKWPDIPATFLVTARDRCINPEWSRRVAARLGAEVVELPTGHSPFLSAPGLLAEALLGLV